MMTASFEDVLLKIGGGRFEILMFLACSSWGLIASMHLMMSAFLVPQTTDFQCQIEPIWNSNWTQEEERNISLPWTENGPSRCNYFERDYSKLSSLSFEEALSTTSSEKVEERPCRKWIYAPEPLNSTVTSEWDLVCEKRYLRSLVQTVFMVGALVSALLGGYLADKFGRLSLIRFGFPMYVVSGFLGALSPTFELFLVSRFFLALSGNFVYLTSYILLLEWCLPHRRGIYGIVFSLPFCLGYMTLPILAFYLRNWRHLLNVLSGVSCLFIFNFIVMRESPRWLLLHGKLNEAVEAVNYACRMNGKTAFEGTDLKLEISQTLKRDDEPKNKNKPKESSWRIWRKPIRKSSEESSLAPRSPPSKERKQSHLGSKKLAKFFLVLTLLWFVSNLVYYGLSLNAGSLGVNIFVYIFLGGLMEIPCYTVIMPFIIKYGRRIPLLAFFGICGASVLLTLIMPKDEWYWCSVMLTMFGKLNITSAFQLLYLYSSEVFPTSLRTRGVGVSSMVGRLGSILSPIVIDIIGPLNWRLPILIFGLSSAAAGALTLLLPETKKKSLPETSDDVETLNQSEETILA